MHDALRQRLLRRIESLPDAQVYQVLDFIEFLESKYAGSEPVEASGLQKFAESLEDKLRKKAVSPATIREAFQLISAADRVLHGVSSAGKQILTDLNQALETPEGEGTPPARESGDLDGGRGKAPDRTSAGRRDRARTGGDGADTERGTRRTGTGASRVTGDSASSGGKAPSRGGEDGEDAGGERR